MEIEFTMLKQGVELLWNFRIDEAEQILSALSDENSVFALHYAECSFLKAVITEDKDDAKIAFDRLYNAQKLARKQKKDISGPFGIQRVLLAKIVQGEVALLDAALNVRLQRQFKGLYNFRKSWKYFEAAAENRKQLTTESPFYEEISGYVENALGFFHFIISVIPREFLWLIEGLGFEANRDLGLQELLSASKLKSIKTTWAKFHLIWINSFFFEDFPAGEAILNDLLLQFPTSVPLQYLGGYVYRKQGKVKEAEGIFKAAHKNGSYVKQIQRFCEYEQGYCAYLNLDFTQAANILQHFLDESPGESFRVYASYQLAMSYELLDKHDLAADMMKKLLPWVRRAYDYDEFSERYAKKYLSMKGKLSAFDRGFHVAMLHYEAFRSDQVLASVAKLESNTDDQKLKTQWLQAATYQRLSNFKLAKDLYQEVLDKEKIAVKDPNTLFVVPHSLTGLAEILFIEKQFDAAEKTFKKAKTFTGYDFSQLLGWRIQRGLEKIRASTKP